MTELGIAAADQVSAHERDLLRAFGLARVEAAALDGEWLSRVTGTELAGLLAGSATLAESNAHLIVLIASPVDQIVAFHAVLVEKTDPHAKET